MASRGTPILPTVATVEGVKVMVFYSARAPPHVHLSDGVDMGIVTSIDDPSLPAWAFSESVRLAVWRWINENADALRAAWDRARAGESPGRVP